ncbi:hypothetical protein QJQ45_019762, partial [Haematococcus lacustris]
VVLPNLFPWSHVPLLWRQQHQRSLKFLARTTARTFTAANARKMQTYKSVGRQGPAVNGSRPVAGRSGRKARVSVLSRSSAMNIRCEKVVGIDLGTTNSAVAAMEGGKPTIITNAEGGRTTPSVVAYTKTGDRLVGQIAKRQAVVNPENTFFSVKRFIGRKMEEVRDESKQVPYKLVEDGARNVKIRSSNTNKEFAPEEISAQVLRKLTADAAKFLNDKVEKAVITVPAYFNDSQRQATKDAGKIAGLEVLRIINEPTAASLAYGFDRKGNETILVFDLGGGTFDVSVLEVGDGVFEVLSTSGDTHLGGDDFDKRITDFLADDFQRTEGIDLRKDRQALQRLTEAAEKAKIELSALTQTSINLPFITATADGPKHIDTSLTRAKFEEMCSDLLRRCRVPVEQALKDAKLNVKDVQEIILVGGSTRIPAVQDIVRKISGRDPNVSVNPDEVVALGAAVQAGVLAGEVSDIVLLDVTPLSLGLETLGGVMTRLIPRNTTLPTSKSEVFSTAADGQTSVEVNVLQGEREFARDNKSLGTFRLDGIPPAARGVPQVEVKFDIDANGILSVTATDKGTGKKQDIKITGASTLGKDDVERMVKEAEKFAGEDKKRREAVDTKNQAESLVYQTEKQLKEFDDKLPADVKASIEGKLTEVRDAVASDDAARMKSSMEALQQEVIKMGQAVYGQPGAGGAPGADGPSAGGPPGNDKGGDDVIDAEFSDRNASSPLIRDRVAFPVHRVQPPAATQMPSSHPLPLPPTPSHTLQAMGKRPSKALRAHLKALCSSPQAGHRHCPNGMKAAVGRAHAKVQRLRDVEQSLMGTVDGLQGDLNDLQAAHQRLQDEQVASRTAATNHSLRAARRCLQGQVHMYRHKCRPHHSPLTFKQRQQLLVLEQHPVSMEVLRRCAEAGYGRLDSHGRPMGSMAEQLSPAGLAPSPSPTDIFIPTQEGPVGRPAARTASYNAHHCLSTVRLHLETGVSRRALSKCRQFFVSEQCVLPNPHQPGKTSTVGREFHIVSTYMRRKTLGLLFSPYKDVTINMEWNTKTISSLLTGSRQPVTQVMPPGNRVLTWAFATGECGSENWGGVPGAQLAAANVQAFVQAGKQYIISTGGAAGAFTCGSDAGFATFMNRYKSAGMLGVDFDIEAKQSPAVIKNLVARVKTARAAFPGMRFSFTVATLGAASRGNQLNAQGSAVLQALRDSGMGWNGLLVNLMVMNYGGASVCTLASNGGCDMGRSAVNAARALNAAWGVPYSSIELTPMIGGNDITSEVFKLSDVQAGRAALATSTVRFGIDANGILSVTATDKGTGKKQDIKITGGQQGQQQGLQHTAQATASFCTMFHMATVNLSMWASTLGKDDVERMVKEAEKFAGEDKKRREAVDTKNQAESLVYQTEKQLKEFDDKLPADVKASIEGKLTEVRDAVASDDAARMKSSMEALQQEVIKMGQAVIVPIGDCPASATHDCAETRASTLGVKNAMFLLFCISYSFIFFSFSL